MEFLSGFESTHIFGSGTDVLATTKHYERVENDLRLAKATGMKRMRYSVPWHLIERKRGEYDWTWLDQALGHMRELEIDPILDPLHHTSFPDWLTDGFANDDFAPSYLRFVTAVARRYPWVRQYTVMNEPFVTTWFCGHEGVWYPYYKGDTRFVSMLMNVIEAIVSVSRMLVSVRPDVRLVHVDAAERHRAVDRVSRDHAVRGNHLRFLVPDLVLGLVGREHELYDYLTRNGASEEQLAAFRERPARIDVMGLDYYAHCELEWCQEGRVLPNRNSEGLVPTAIEYAERYRLPIMLSETNIRGHVSDRISWLKFMVEQCEEIERKINAIGLPFEGFCWYPFIDSTDWCSLVREANNRIDPQGIYWLEPGTLRRNPSELSFIFGALARGDITSKDIPAYRFREPLDRELKGLLPFMSHWKWRSAEKAKPATDRGRRRRVEIAVSRAA
jgi:beta-glucosidase/6-phospho-beta-glucosidase/beta-galactosidase